MALIKCKECGKEISSKAKTCPNCGVARGEVATAAKGCFTSIFKAVFGLIGALIGLAIATHYLYPK